MQNSALQVYQVLLIDDDHEDFILTRTMLGKAQGSRYSLDWACDYDMGLLKLRSQTYNAVLVDYDLGNKTGIQLIREICASDYPAPLILYTGRGNYEVDVEALEAGASFYISKGDANALLLDRLIRYAVRQKQIEQKLEDSLQERMHLLESIQDSFFSINRDWVITFMNNKAAQSGNVKPETIIGRNLWEVFPELENSVIGQKYKDVMHNRVPAQFESTGVYHDTVYSVKIYPSTDGISVFAQDIKTRTEAEQTQQSLIRFPSENPNPVLRVDPNGQLLYSNPASQEVLQGWGVSKTGKVPDDIQALVRDSLSSNSPVQIEQAIVKKTYQINLVPFSRDGYLNIYMVDQTQRRKTEEALKKASDEAVNEKNRSLAVMQILPAGLAITDGAGGIVLSNTAYERIWGYPIPETLSINDYADFHAWWLETGQPIKPEEWASAQAVQHGKAIEKQMLRIQRFDGSDAYVMNSAAPIIDAQGNIIGSVVVIQDITNLYTLQSELKATNQDLQSIMDAAPGYIFITHDRQARYLTGNLAAYELLQAELGENLSETASESSVKREFRAFREGNEIPPQILPIQRAAAGEIIKDYEMTLQFKDGQVIHLYGNAAPLNQTPGNSEGAVGVFIDITMRKRMEEELRNLNERLKASNQELEQFATIASHDMQEPLRKIISFSNILMDSAGNLDESQRENIHRLSAATHRMKGMITDLLNLSKISTHGSAFSQVDLSQVAAEVLTDLEIQIRNADAQIELNPLPSVEGDAMQLRQLFQNLIANAIKFQKPGQKPHIRITGQKTEQGKVQISIEDNGIGFNEMYARRIFRPFERLVGRSEYEGTGIGLAICDKIIARHSGEISVRSTPGEGSVFIITLPG